MKCSRADSCVGTPGNVLLHSVAVKASRRVFRGNYEIQNR